ncbi:MAG: hypothetical protein KDD69_10210 [Bdellovibrionales bacterium]|nr:hypothetical protein [Bdellovibrionales bacterium]
MKRPISLLLIIAALAIAGYLLIPPPVSSPELSTSKIHQEPTVVAPKDGGAGDDDSPSDSAHSTEDGGAEATGSEVTLAPLTEQEMERLKLTDYETYLRVKHAQNNRQGSAADEGDVRAAARERVRERLLNRLEENRSQPAADASPDPTP